MSKKQLTRLFIQLGVAVGFTMLFIQQDYDLSDQPLFTWLGWLDPLQGIAAVRQGHWLLLGLLSLGALLLAVFYGRLFCGWICPVGTVLDLSRFLKRLVRLPDWIPVPNVQRVFQWLRWILLGGVLGLILAGYSLAMFLNPLVVWPRETYRILNGMIPWSIIGFLAIGLITFPRFWCRFLCPAGSILNLAGRLGKSGYSISKECRSCGKCTQSCPMRNITLKPTDPAMEQPSGQIGTDCLKCGQCVRSCPFSAVAKESVSDSGFDEGRRDFLTATGIGLGTLGIAYVGRKMLLDTNEVGTGNSPHRWSRLLRPPGALDEHGLMETCNRCGQCLQVCPTKVLVPAGLEAGLEGLSTPRFVPQRKPNPGRCMFCMACGKVCPTKALAPVETYKLGTAEINRNRCLVWEKGIQCMLCVETCPRFAITLDSLRRPVLNSQKCNGCGSCEAHCPVEGSAVLLTNAGEIRRKS